MRIQFLDAPQTPAPRLVARTVDQDALPADLDPVLAEGAKAARFAGKAGQVHEHFISQGGKVVRLALAGLGEKSGTGPRRCGREGRRGACRQVSLSGETALTLDLAGSSLTATETAGFLLGLRLRAWRYDAYRTKLAEDQKPTLADVFVINAPAGAEAEWQSGEAVAEAVEFTRQLVTEPGNIIYPESFVARCETRLAGTGIELSVLDETQMGALGMGALLGVAQGSVRRPRLLVLQWHGGDPGGRPVALVGKGVTFDSGGISIKGAAGMEDMKWDMGGAGAVVGAMLALAGRKAKANVVAVCGLVENMPDGGAQRPGDVVTTMSGQTVEVINTDAEGRLVLCDALTYVQKEFSPVALVDLATLTGAIIASLASEYAGIFSNDDILAGKLLAAGEACGEKLWRMPMGQSYDKLIDSAIADMKNQGGRHGGSITAAQFLQRFVDKGRRGRISTSPAWSGPTSRGRPGTRARPVSACGCSTATCGIISKLRW